MRVDFIPTVVPLALAMSIPVTLTACFPDTSRRVELEPPESVCQTSPASWQGIVPGQSTIADVVEILGEPARKERSRWNTDVFVYQPIIALPGGGNYGNRIIFHDDDIVDLIDVWVLDSDGKFHTVAEFAQLYGTTLDRVYVNGYFDMSGPDQIYVWSHCGITVMAVSEECVKREASEVLSLAEVIDADSYQLDFRHPVHSRASRQPSPDVREVVARKYLFQSTSFTSFEEFYAGMIPYFHFRAFETRLAGE